MRLFRVLDEFPKMTDKDCQSIQDGMNMYMSVGDAER